MIMCLTVGLRHNLTWQAQVDILKMINAIYEDERIPNTKYMYFNHIDKSGDYLKYHIFCPECERYLDNTNDLSESVNCNCGHVITVYSSNYFVSIDLESQFKILLKNTSIVDSLLTYRFNRSKINDTALEDIYDGAEYKKYFDKAVLVNPDILLCRDEDNNIELYYVLLDDKLRDELLSKLLQQGFTEAYILDMLEDEFNKRCKY